MLIVYHTTSTITAVERNDTTVEIDTSKSLITTIENLAELFPSELLIWCDISIRESVNFEKFQEIFSHQRIMASYAPNAVFVVPEQIGYVDETPFLNVNFKVTYPTWFMSSLIGGVNTKVIQNFSREKIKTDDFSFYLNLLARKAMWQGLFCYSEPKLLKETSAILPSVTSESNYSNLFRFIRFNNKVQWLFYTFFCVMYFDRRFPLVSFLKGLFFQKSNAAVNCIEGLLFRNETWQDNPKIDVLIPTIGRKKYIYDVLVDLKHQILLPNKVIIVEQNPDTESVSALDFLNTEKWPFEIDHTFTHQPGACNARNIGLNKISGDWVFFADDDIRIGASFLDEALSNLKNYKQNGGSFYCYQEGEKPHFQYPLQWGTFGSGCSIVKKESLHQAHFDMRYEFGFGEDGDFGMQLRQSGTDIVYFPTPSILHLKAPIGGFRYKHIFPWENNVLKPKPSPTVLLFQKRYLTLFQQRGAKFKLFLNYYKIQSVKNPLKYFRIFKKQWSLSEYWVDKL